MTDKAQGASIYYPPFPEPHHERDDCDGTVPFFTAGQMLAYARDTLKAQPARDRQELTTTSFDRQIEQELNIKAQPAPTEAQGSFLVRVTPIHPEYSDVHPELALEDALRVNTYGWPDGFQFEFVAAQGEDSARLECAHANGRTAHWDWLTCDDCGAVHTGDSRSSIKEWGIANNMWFKSIGEAKFYKANGRYPDRARASAETGGVKS
jgi:hypothetical protein